MRGLSREGGAPSWGQMLFGPGQWWRTLLVVLAMAVMVRLGFWQLDRLAQRRARNAQVLAQVNAPPLDLNRDPIPARVDVFKYRRLVARGRFDFAHQIALKNRTYQGRPGVDLITPLRLEGRHVAVLVDRGWIPYEAARPAAWAAFDTPRATVVITGFVGLDGVAPPRLPRPILPDEHQAVYYVDPPSLADLMPYPLLPFYMVWMPAPGEQATSPPLKYTPHYDLSEGPHLGYAIQWFLFAAAAPFVYLYLLRRR